MRRFILLASTLVSLLYTACTSKVNELQDKIDEQSIQIAELELKINELETHVTIIEDEKKELSELADKLISQINNDIIAFGTIYGEVFCLQHWWEIEERNYEHLQYAWKVKSAINGIDATVKQRNNNAGLFRPIVDVRIDGNNSSIYAKGPSFYIYDRKLEIAQLP